MSKFNEQNFYRILTEIEDEEKCNTNFWLSVGILEHMYDDDMGYIQRYFETKEEYRDPQELWNHLNNFDI